MVEPFPDSQAPHPDKPGHRWKDGDRVRSIPLRGLFLLALLYTLHFAKHILIPIVVAVLLALLFLPLVRWFKRRLHLPEAWSAAVIMVGLLGIMIGSVFFVAEPAGNWLQALPGKIPEIESRLNILKRPIQKMTAASAEVERLAALPDSAQEKQSVQVAAPTPLNMLMSQTPAFLANFTAMLVLTYFLLVSGDLFLRKLVAMNPAYHDQKKTVEIFRNIEGNVSKYLQMTTGINLGLGFLIGLAAYFVGLKNYLLWGVLAYLLNYVPYLGAMAGMLAVFLVGLMSFASTSQALVMPGIYFVLAVIEGNFITPMTMSRFMILNPVAIFISLMFWGWIWGIVGVFLAVPILTVAKIFCDRIDPLKPVGEFLGH